MAPEPEILKRKRSRPSDWWANASIIASTPQRLPIPPTTTQDESETGPTRNRHRRLIPDETETHVRDAPAAANRGRPPKKRQTEADANDENTRPDENEKLLRRGRSSGNAEELRDTADSSRDEPGARVAKKKRGSKSAREQVRETEILGEGFGPRRRGRPAVVQADQEESADLQEPARDKSGPNRRGRPSNKVSEVSSAVQEEPEIAEPKKRRRHPTVDKKSQGSDEQAPKVQEGPKKRGKRPVKATTDGVEEHVVPAAAKKRARRSDADVLNQDPRPLTDEESVRGRPRTRRSDAKLQVPEVTTPQVSTQEERDTRRTQLSDVQLQRHLAPDSMRTQRGKGRKTSRQPQATSVIVETASSKLTRAPSRSKRVSRNIPDKAANVQDSGQTKQLSQPSSSSAKRQASSQALKKTSKQKSNVEPPRKRKEIDDPEITPGKRRRLSKVAREEATHIPEPEDSSMLYQHLKPVSRKVSRQTIAAKWEPLPLACAERVSRLLQDIQRPVVVHLNDERKKMQASTALQMVSRRLVGKISKGLPFPPATRSHREDDFDFEKILDHNRALEAQLTPSLHGNELLEAELAKEIAWLEADQEVLAELEKNAKSEATTRSQAARKLHVLVQFDESQTNGAALKDDIGMEDVSHHVLPLDLSIHDNDLQGLIKGLHGHVDTINGNMKQVSGISEAIVRSKAAIQGTLFDHLSDVQYGEVILGSELSD